MNQPVKFELRVIVSLMNDMEVLQTTEQEKEALVRHITGEAMDYDVAMDHLQQTEKFAEVAAIVRRHNPDQRVYNKLIDMYGKMHVIEPASVAAL